MNRPRFDTLPAWLEWQQSLSLKEIVLGLERVRTVGARLELLHPSCPVITVGGTNGKGSVIALLEAMLRAEGYKVGAFTSPHLLRYNERVRIAGVDVDDALFCQAFDAIDQARDDLPLTYFEFGTLAALSIFATQAVDIMLLEVGMGGRLDAVNAIDADVAVVTTVDIDHAEWLGSDRESIGREKAGILRATRPAICGDRQPPASLCEYAQQIGARLSVLGRDFEACPSENGMVWQAGGMRRELPLPALSGAFQLDNAATALAALDALAPRLPLTDAAYAHGLRTAHVAGRYQRLPGPPPMVCDVAHNPQAARALASILRADPVPGRNLMVFSALADKDIPAIASALDTVAGHWFVAGLDAPRGLTADDVAERLGTVRAGVSRYVDVATALAAARASAASGDRVVVCGSFLTVAVALSAGL
ncbi:bifunctional tetrahydrofolate synthase/dihydrofolate synthase [Acidihalobacter ferrooxydans]|uniref:Dihydrofolate synthase/folylpolyglutamate synthase n=1 Tax=Acidihalobacter ferrooxydans TaxID=1765967 RepID=A0A1P8UGK8_9GAMM|nr:bifunctional tetrahydrofolate synthase/dihydrofolate synthase [Acidihalobacter ferrooxydans]APZ42949.1 bifunctional tetrahydrofolate synthase/dihydrofolate synthase [Acidihalobacter ferrooxydans]